MKIQITYFDGKLAEIFLEEEKVLDQLEILSENDKIKLIQVRR